MSSFMVFRGDRWASAINPEPVAALFPAQDDLPEGVVLEGFDAARGDLCIRTKYAEVAIFMVLNVAPAMRGEHPLCAWNFTPTALETVLDDLWEVYDGATLDFKQQFTDAAGTLLPMSLHDFGNFLQLLVKHNDATYPDALIADRPAQIHGADAFTLPAAPEGDDARWDTARPEDPEDTLYGTTVFVNGFIHAIDLQAIYDSANDDVSARRLGQLVKAFTPVVDVERPPIAAFKSAWGKLSKTRAGELLDKWPDAILQDPTTMALDFLGALLDASKTIPASLLPSIITNHDAQQLLKTAHEASGTGSTSNIMSVFSYCITPMMTAHPEARELMFDLRHDAPQAWAFVAEHAFLSNRKAPGNMLEILFELKSAIQRYNDECMPQAVATPLDIRLAVFARLNTSPAAFVGDNDSGSSSGAAASSSSSTPNSQVVSLFESAPAMQALATVHLDTNKLLTSDPFDVVDFIYSDSDSPASLNLIRLLLSSSVKQFAGRTTDVAMLITALQPNMVAWVANRLANPTSTLRDVPTAPWSITTNASSLPHHISPKVMKPILAGAWDKVDWLDFASSLKAFGLNGVHTQVKIDPNIKRPIFSLPAHADLACGALAAVVAAIGLEDGPYGVAYLHKIIKRWMNELPAVRPEPKVMQGFYSAVVSAAANDIANANARAKMGALTATPSFGVNVGSLTAQLHEIDASIATKKTISPYLTGSMALTNSVEILIDLSALQDGSTIVDISTPTTKKGASDSKRPADGTSSNNAKRTKSKDSRQKADGGGSTSTGSSSSASNASNVNGRSHARSDVPQSEIDEQNTFFREHIDTLTVNGKPCIRVKGKPGYFIIEALRAIKRKFHCATYVYAAVRDLSNWDRFIHPGSRNDTSRQPQLSEEMKNDLKQAWISPEGAVIANNGTYSSKN